MRIVPSVIYRNFPLVFAAGLLVSCDTPQKRGLRELSKIGIEPSGRALLDAVADQDARRVGWLLDVGVYTEPRDARGRTPVADRHRKQRPFLGIQTARRPGQRKRHHRRTR